MPKLKVGLGGREQIADATYAFTLDLRAQPLAYKAGQTIDLTYLDMPRTDAAGNKRTFSIASAPESGRILFATRDRGSAFKRCLIEAPLGSVELELDGPYGSFTLPNKPTAAVFLAGGIGVTPFRAMAEDLLRRSLEHKLTLIHSNRTPEEAAFLEELQGWAGRGTGFSYLPTMTRPEASKKPWKGERRRVDAASLREWLPPGAALHYVAGPEGFVHAAAEALKVAGVDEDQVRVEEFPGY